MDIRSVTIREHHEVERATRYARIAGFGSWLVGWAILAAALMVRAPWLFALFAAWYFAIAAVIVVVAAIPRRSQRMLYEALNRQFQELAIRDDLTGLYNRRYFHSELEAQFQESRTNGRPLTVALVDLNDFKSINDTFGHAAGDMALRIAGHAIVESAPAGATVARTSGDEFAIIMPDKSRAEGESVAAQIRLALRAADYVVAKSEHVRGRIQATVGLATLGVGVDPSGLLQEADASLYQRKRAERAA